MHAANDLQITLSDVCKRFKVSWKTANRWAKSGKLMAAKIGGQWRTSEEWIQQFINPMGTQLRKARTVNVSNSEEAYRILEARWGIKKVPRT